MINSSEYIVASSYEGTVLCLDYSGKTLWENKLSGYYNQDIYCGDIDGDGNDEILAANSDGALYCIDDNGKLMWSFRPTEAPMNAVSIIHSEGKPYVACGGYDTYLYYLDQSGALVSKVAATTYSKEKGWGVDAPKKPAHIANFIRTVRSAEGEEVLALLGAINSMSARGSLYLFEPLATKPYKNIAYKAQTVKGDFAINDLSEDGADRIMLGSTKDTRGGYISELDIEGADHITFDITKLAKAESQKFGYRVAQSEVVKIGGKTKRVI
ncbi:MAG: PQQ-binding-like beta-propeller repeat protein, partial [Rikenellaceae bacterium]